MLPLHSTLLRWCCLMLLGISCTAGEFANFETAPAHPVDLAPDGYTLAVCHLADNRLLLFDVSSGVPVPMGSVRVGHDPTAVRFRTSTEAWVVNHISSNVTVV